MPSLLDLPRELRDIIINLVVSTPAVDRPDLQNRDSITTGDRIELNDIKYRSWTDGQNVKYARRSLCTNSGALLLVNRQLHAETLEVLNGLPTRHSYELDVVIVDEKELYPMWTSVPALSTRVDRVYTTVRLFGSGPYYSLAFRGTDGGPPMMAWYFYSLLERFLERGPVGPRKVVPRRPAADGADIDCCIKTLDIDILTPAHIPSDQLAPADVPTILHLARLRKKSGVNFAINPEYVVKFLGGMIETLLGMSCYTAAYGLLLYERLGVIRLMLDGEVRYEWDVADRLARLQFDEYTLRKSEFYRTWRKKAYKTRQRLGLPVIPPSPESYRGGEDVYAS